MVLNSHHSLTASTTLASVVSAVILTAVGLCIPYTERGARNRVAPPASTSKPGASGQAASSQRQAVPGTADGRLIGPNRSAEAAQP
jgi:hypothetical protein